MAGRRCRVRYKNLEGVVHTVDVIAESVYEASVLALSALSKHDWIENIGPGTRLEIQIIDPNATHTLLVAQLRSWARPTAQKPVRDLEEAEVEELLAS